jgi:uncharacterized protein (TIGR02284 family)
MQARHQDHGKILEALQAVLTRYVDSSLGFLEAAKLVDAQPIAAVLEQIADARAEDAAQIAASLEVLGWHADASGSREARLHRWWIDLRDKFSGSDPSSLIDECQRGETELLRTIKLALADDSGEPLPAYQAALEAARSNVLRTLAMLDTLTLAAATLERS